MYVSDYGFAADPSAWTTNLFDFNNASENNWMYMGLQEWTITREAGGPNDVFMVYDIGGVSYYTVDSISYVVRPTFSLLSSTTYVSGSGTANDPILIN